MSSSDRTPRSMRRVPSESVSTYEFRTRKRETPSRKMLYPVLRRSCSKWSSRAGADLRTGLGVYPLQPDDANQVRASLPVNNAAVKAYSEGMTKMWAFDFVGARGDLDESAESGSELPARARSFVRCLLASRVHGKERLRGEARCRFIEAIAPGATDCCISGQYAKATLDWPAAAKIYQVAVRVCGRIASITVCNSQPRNITPILLMSKRR